MLRLEGCSAVLRAGPATCFRHKAAPCAEGAARRTQGRHVDSPAAAQLVGVPHPVLLLLVNLGSILAARTYSWPYSLLLLQLSAPACRTHRAIQQSAHATTILAATVVLPARDPHSQTACCVFGHVARVIPALPLRGFSLEPGSSTFCSLAYCFLLHLICASICNASNPKYLKPLHHKMLLQHPRPTYVGVDLSQSSLQQALQGTPFLPHRPALFICEGLVYYLPQVSASHLCLVVVHSQPCIHIPALHAMQSVQAAE